MRVVERPSAGTEDACGIRADSAWPVVHTTLPYGSSTFIFDSISSPIVGYASFSWSPFRVVPSSPAVKKKIHRCGYGKPASASYPLEVDFTARICRKPVEPGKGGSRL